MQASNRQTRQFQGTVWESLGKSVEVISVKMDQNGHQKLKWEWPSNQGGGVVS